MALTTLKRISLLDNNLFLKATSLAGFNGCRCYVLPSLKKELVTYEETRKDFIKPRKSVAPLDFRFIYPEFLPDPDVRRRNHLREKLERLDMMSRRTHIDVPEFYVGSVLAVTISDPHSLGKTSKFVGICIERKGCGLRAEFTIRNIIDHQGIEVRYEIYDPAVQRIQVLRLEKRLDDTLFYLRDALEEYSTFDVNMEPEILSEGVEVPVNKMQVQLKPRPWLEKYERQDLKGIKDIKLQLRYKSIVRMKIHAKPWEKYDLMKQYRSTVPEQEQIEIWADVYSQLHNLEITRRKLSRKRSFSLPSKSA